MIIVLTIFRLLIALTTSFIIPSGSVFFVIIIIVVLFKSSFNILYKYSSMYTNLRVFFIVWWMMEVVCYFIMLFFGADNHITYMNELLSSVFFLVCLVVNVLSSVWIVE
jgi:hypothetical protein